MPNTLKNFQALSIDTSIFEKYQFNFTTAVLKALEQFSNSSPTIIIPQIIYDEVLKHYTRLLESKQKEAQKGIKALKPYFDYSDVHFDDFYKIQDISEYAQEKLNLYFKQIGAKIIDGSYVNMDKLTQMYSRSLPPFDKTGKKKCEFPDAIALMAIESWSKENYCNTLALSADKGWKDYAKSTCSIEVSDDLPKAIAYFIPTLVSTVVTNYLTKHFLQEPEFESKLDEYINNEINDTDLSATASSPDYFEIDLEYLTLEDYHLERNKDSIPKFEIFSIEEDNVSIRLAAVVNLTAFATIEFYHHTEDILLGSKEFSKGLTEHVDILIDLSGEVFTDNEVHLIDTTTALIIENIEIDSIPSFIDFDTIEVSDLFDDEYYYEEEPTP
ncbi:MAG: PIN domain-containing protein [Desulfovibrio sp.]